MKTIGYLIMGAILPFLAVAQDNKAPVAANPRDLVITSFRITPKDGQDEALKAAIKAHAEKFHKGSWSWRLGQVISGPGGNSYQIIEGPFFWTDFDGRGDLGVDHMKDYETTIAPHAERTTPDTYATYDADLSTVGAMEWTSKVMVIRYTVKPGKGSLAQDILKSYKAANLKRGLKVAVWHSAFSGENVYSCAFRLQNGWKTFDENLPSMRTTLAELAGPNEYARLLAASAEAFSDISSEMVEYLP